MRERMKIATPIVKTICKSSDQRILENWIMRKVGTGIDTVKGLAIDAAEPESTIREAISRLIRKGDLRVRRSKKTHTFRLTRLH